jgi:hypothetical protein
MTKPLSTFDQAIDSAKFRFISMRQPLRETPSPEVTELILRFAAYQTACEQLAAQDVNIQVHMLGSVIFEVCKRKIEHY